MTAVPAAGTAMSWIVVVWMAILGGLATPQGVPPLPDCPVLAKIAPEQCLGYLSVSGLAVPNSKSMNQTEQLLAEPEVQALKAQFEEVIRASLNQQLPAGVLPPDVSSNDVADLLKIIMARPVAVYVSSVEMQPAGLNLRGGMAIHLGDMVADVQAKFEKLATVIPPQMVREITIGGAKWRSIEQLPIGPVVFGFRGKYFLAAVGQGELEAMIGRARGNAPAWLNQLREQSPAERVSMISYLNLKAITGLAMPMAGPQVMKTASDLGFDDVMALGSVVGLDKSGCVSRTMLQIEGQPQGLLRFVDIKPLAASDLAAIPADSTVALAVKINPLSVFDAYLDAMEKVDPKAQANMLRAIAQMESQFGLKVRDEVLKSLGDTLVVYGSPGETRPPIAVATLQVKDSQQATKTFAKLMQLAEALLGRDNPAGVKLIKNKVEGKDVYVLQAPIPGVPPIVWCLTEKELVVGVTLQAVQSHLATSPGFKPLDQSSQVAAALKSGSGPLALLYCDVPRLFDLIYPTLPQAASAMQAQGINLNPASLPSAKTIRAHLAPLVAVVEKTPSGVAFEERYSLPGLSVTSSTPMAVGLLLPAIQASRESARRVQSMNNMKQIALAMLVHENAHGSFPAAYKADKGGKPLLSWRVLILPYLDQDGLYKEFHLDEPWDSEHNKKLIARMPSTYKSPTSRIAAEGKTNYLTVRGPRTAFSDGKGVKLMDIKDGTSNTVMTVEVPDDKAVIWTKPDDFQYDEQSPGKGLIGMRPGGFLAGMCDGSVRFLPATINADTLKLLFMRNDGQPTNIDGFGR